MLVGVFGLLAVGIRAATSVRSEYQKDTFDALLTSPMSSEEILFGKWLGSVLSVRWLALWLLVIWMIGVLTGGMNLFMFPLLVASWLIYAALAASLGLWFSVTRKTSLWAMVATLCTFFLITLGHWLPMFCCATFRGPGGVPGDAMETLMQIQLGVTPQAVLAFLPFRTEELTEHVSNSRWIPIKLIIFAMGGTFCWGIVAWGLWQATNERFKRLTFRDHPTAADKLRRIVLADPRREQ
jgi:ABC-type transport system involved in multi-copper enzyme maturation permease subunit